MSDLTRLRERLAPLEEQADGLPWAKERPWRVATHVELDRELLVVDLHDLGIKLALAVLDSVVELAPELDRGAVCFITGRGRHSIDGRSRLREAVVEAAWEAARQRGWMQREQVGRVVLVWDAERAPARASGGLEWWVWAGIAAFLGLAVVTAPAVGVPLLVVAVLWWLLGRGR